MTSSLLYLSVEKIGHITQEKNKYGNNKKTQK